MKRKASHKNLAVNILFRTCFTAFPFLLWFFLSQVIHWWLPDFSGGDLPESEVRIIKIFLSFLALYSSFRLFSAYDGFYATRFFESVRPESRLQCYAFILKSYEFWLPVLGAAILFPAIIDRFPLTAAFWADPEIPWQLILLLSFLFFFCGILFAHRRAQKYWLAATGTHPIRSALKNLILMLIFYPVSALLAKAVFPTIDSLIKIFGRASVILPFLMIFAVFWLILVIRATGKRRKFFKSLRELCERSGYALSGIRGGYRSIFLPFGDAEFTVRVGEKTYDCKMICCLRRTVPVILSPDGVGLFLHTLRIARVEVFRYATAVQFGKPEDGKKLLIAVPVSAFVFSGSSELPENGGSRMPKTGIMGRGSNALLMYLPQVTVHTGTKLIDTGDSVGNFKFFTATGFLGALERDVLDR